MKMVNIRRELRRQYHSLAETADTVGGRVASQIGEPSPQREAIPGASTRAPPAAPETARLLIEIFRKIEQRGTDQLVDRVTCAIGRVAQRDDQDIEPALLESEDLLGDKSLG